MKFNNVLLAICLLGFFANSCSETEQVDDNLITLEPIHLDDIKKLIPSSLLSDSKVSYKNVNGEEKTLSVFFDSIIREVSVNDIKYMQERFSIAFQDSSDLTFRMDLSGNGVYTNEFAVEKTISAFLMPGHSASSSITIDTRNGKIVINEHVDHRDAITLNMTTFTNVFIGKNDFNETGRYDEIMLNLEVGIVAFKDGNKKLWVFDRFEN